jgi:hypothetical protein
MAYNVTVNGLQLYQGGGGLPLTPALGEYSFVRNSVSTSTQRKKPVDLSLLVDQTPYNKSVKIRYRAMQRDSSGYQSPSTYNASTETFDSETYNNGRPVVVNKLLSKIKGEEWNLSTFLGELPETLAWFRKTLVDVVDYYRAFRKMSARQLRAVRKRRRKAYAREGSRAYLGSPAHERAQAGLASRWLEFRYAITPLMSDFDAMLKTLYSSMTTPLWKRVVSGEDLKYYRKSVVFTGSPSCERIQDHTMELRIGAYFRCNPEAQALKRLGLTNPLATLYELLPLSFVLDWFIPLGTWLGNLDAMVGVQVLSTWESQKVVTLMHYTGGAQGPSGSRTIYEPSDARNDYYNRQPSASLTIPLPKPRLSLNAKRTLDAVALSRQILLSGK